MPGLLPHVDPDGLLEYSVVFTDRSLNHMSQTFQGVMRDISSTMKTVYNAEAVAIVPGGGTFGMEAVARQLANGQKCLIIRNGWFSYRWTQILEMGRIASETVVLKAQPIANGHQSAYAPAAIEAAVETIRREQPALIFVPHVETSSGMILPEEYIRSLAEAIHAVGGLLVLDCKPAAWMY
jgi:aspartate aminotransferase-like enzyme